MATFDYVEVPSAATRLHSRKRSTDLRPAVKIATALPHPEKAPRSATLTPTEPMSPSKVPSINFSQVLLSSAIPIPANAPATPRDTKGTPKLLSTKDPLSIPITTVNFKRFVSRAGPVFWLQDRLEEIVMWRRGWKYTSVWIAGYAFLCTSCSSSWRNALIWLHIRLLSSARSVTPDVSPIRCSPVQQPLDQARCPRSSQRDSNSTSTHSTSQRVEYRLVI